MLTISFLGQKGGAGKSTLAIHIAVFAVQNQLSVLLADTDPQRSVVEWGDSREDELPLIAECSPTQIKDIQQAARDESIDILIIDSPGRDTSDIEFAIQHSDAAIIPTRPGVLDLRAIQKTLNVIKNHKTRAGIVLNACPPRNKGKETSIVQEARQALSIHELAVCPTQITNYAAFGHALIDGRAVIEYEPNGNAAIEIANLYNWINKEVSHGPRQTKRVPNKKPRNTKANKITA